MQVELLLLRYLLTIGWELIKTESDFLNSQFYFIERFNSTVAIPKKKTAKYNKHLDFALKKISELEELKPLELFKRVITLHREKISDRQVQKV